MVCIMGEHLFQAVFNAGISFVAGPLAIMHCVGSLGIKVVTSILP